MGVEPLEAAGEAADLTGSGYRLMGGRLIATSHGPAAMFMYDDDRGDRLVVLTRPMASEQSAPMAPHSGGDVSGFAWADGGMGYSLMGQAAADPSSRSPTRFASRRTEHLRMHDLRANALRVCREELQYRFRDVLWVFFDGSV